MCMSVPQIAVLRDPDQHVVVADLGLRHLAPARCPGSRSSLDQCLHRWLSLPMTPQLAADLARRPRPRGRAVASVCAADICVRMRALPLRHDREREADHVDALARAARSAIRAASAASPSITGMIGCSPGTSVKPGRCHAARGSAAALRASCVAQLRRRPRAGRARAASAAAIDRRQACSRRGTAASAGAASRRSRLRAAV